MRVSTITNSTEAGVRLITARERKLMSLGMVLVTVLCGLVFAFQLYTSFRLVRFSGYSAGQKIAQLFLVWLIPLFGSWIINSIISSTVTRLRAADRDFSSDAGTNPLGIGVP